MLSPKSANPIIIKGKKYFWSISIRQILLARHLRIHSLLSLPAFRHLVRFVTSSLTREVMPVVSHEITLLVSGQLIVEKKGWEEVKCPLKGSIAVGRLNMK